MACETELLIRSSVEDFWRQYVQGKFINSLIPLSFGFNAGYAINPARDFSPRLFTLIAGWGTETFSYNDTYWFYVPIVAPFIGGAVGAASYTLLVCDTLCIGAKRSLIRKFSLNFRLKTSRKRKGQRSLTKVKGSLE